MESRDRFGAGNADNQAFRGSVSRHAQNTIRTQAPNGQAWLTFFQRALAEQVARLEKTIERERIVLAALTSAITAVAIEFAHDPLRPLPPPLFLNQAHGSRV